MNQAELGPEIEALADEVGNFIRYWGFKRIHGRIWTHIFLSTQPLDAGTLLKRLNVSKALMSLSLNDLLKYNVILEGKKSSKGTQTYVANPEVIEVILNVLRRREKLMLSHIKTSCDLVKGLSEKEKEKISLNEERVDCLANMIRQAQETLDSVLALGDIKMADWGQLNCQPLDGNSMLSSHTE